jgi:hypothetical protein
VKQMSPRQIQQDLGLFEPAINTLHDKLAALQHAASPLPRSPGLLAACQA